MTQTPPAKTKKDQSIFLSFSDCPRIQCGLRWDPSLESNACDLDLVYALYDEFGTFVSAVSGKQGDRIDESGSLYHSGDDSDGNDTSDDERLTLDLLGMPRRFHHIFLAVEIRSEHTFSEVPNPYIHIFRPGKSQALAEAHLKTSSGSDFRAYLFARLERQSGGWSLHLIERYPADGNIPEWGEYLLNYLPRKTAAPGEKVAAPPPVPKKGEAVPLHYTRQSRHRIVCGLSWDSPAPVTDSKGRKTTAAPYDLDLTCIMFDGSGEYIDYVTSQSDKTMDQSGAVYHTGDDTSGEGKGDDEQVSVELARLPEDVCHVVFIVEMKSQHSLGEVRNPKVRIADGMTDRTQLEAKLGDAGEMSACIFARLVRKGDGWQLHYIGEYVDADTIEDWTQPVAPYLA